MGCIGRRKSKTRLTSSCGTSAPWKTLASFAPVFHDYVSEIANAEVLHAYAAVALSNPVGTYLTLAGNSVALAAQQPSQTGQWSQPIPMPIVPIHVSLLPDGKVLLWRHGHQDLTDANGNSYVADNPTPYVWDVNAPLSDANPKLVDVPKIYPNGQHTDEIYCSGQGFLPDGRLIAVGGHLSKYNTPPGQRNDEFTASPQAHLFDYTQAQPWSLAASMSSGRWYATYLTLGDGEGLVTGGIVADDEFGQYQYNVYPELYDSALNAFRTLAGASWAVPTYPWMYNAPGGAVGAKAFYAGPGPDTRFIDVTGQGQWGQPIPTTFGMVRSPSGVHQSTSVLYDHGKILNAGGISYCCGFSWETATPTNAAEVIDLNVASPSWTQVASMNYPRQHLNSTLLPTGKVLVTGGSSAAGFSNVAGAILAAELWDPGSNSWSLLASGTEPRLHHSIAMLLPDGRVLVGGGGETGFAGEVSHPSFEIFSPPSLFKGARPLIAAAPQTIRYRDKVDTFDIQTNVPNIGSVVLIRLPSVTHAFNQNQSFARLSFTKIKGGLRAMTPADRNVAPPGHYMLFIVTSNGAPSVAKIVQLVNF